jgi:hypothetical protein
MVSLDRYEVCSAGSELFFIFYEVFIFNFNNRAHYCNLHKECAGKHKKGIYSTRIAEIRHIECDKIRKKNHISSHRKCYFTWYCPLLDKKKSTGGMEFRRELMAFEGGINGRNEIPPGMSRS